MAQLIRWESFPKRTAPMKTNPVVVALSLAFVFIPAQAHHSFIAEFDVNRPVHLEGVVAKFDWTNPHVMIYLDVISSGKTAHWIIECASPNALLRRGFSKTSLSPGDAVVIEGYQAKSGAARAAARDIILNSGIKVVLGSYVPGSAAK